MKKLNLIAHVVLFSFIATPSFAEEVKPVAPVVPPTTEAPAPKSFVGAMAGYAISTSSGGQNSFVFGGRIGTSLFGDESGDISLGLAIERLSNDVTVGAVKVDESITALMAEIVCRRAWKTGLYFGTRLGLGLVNASVTTTTLNDSGSGTSFIWGPVAGYEFNLSPSVVFSVDTSWLSLTSGELSFISLGKIKYNSASAFMLQGGISYHF